MMNDLRERTRVLSTYPLATSQIEELLAYNHNNFQSDRWKEIFQLPLADEPHIATWKEYVAEAEIKGYYIVLQQYLVQLQFPIASGISDREEYRAATRKGADTRNLSLATGLPLQAPEKLELRIEQTIAGKIPLIIAGDRPDFISLVRALTRRNEPQPIPDSVGACIVGGYNNWHRLQQYRQRWQNHNPQGNWQQEFTRIIPQKHLYQDRFILLSRGNYSGVSASQLGLTAEKWQELSLKIRLEHECTHYLTRRFFNSMQNNLLDELIADYRGIVSAWGCYRADWWLHFMGLENDTYRQGGRLENYLRDPPLSAAAFQTLQILTKQAALNLEKFDRQYHQERDPAKELATFIALTQTNLESLAAVNGVRKLLNNTQKIQEQLNLSQLPTAFKTNN